MKDRQHPKRLLVWCVGNEVLVARDVESQRSGYQIGNGEAASVRSENLEVPIAMMVKQHKGATYLFAVGMRDGVTTATFTLAETNGEKVVEVLGEDRTIAIKNGSFSDRFGPWDVHLYRL